MDLPKLFNIYLLLHYHKLFDLHNCFFDGDKAIYSPDKKHLLCCNHNLTEYSVLEGTETIGSGAFISCNVQRIHIPETVTKIGLGAFINCTALTKIRFPQSLKELMSNKEFKPFTGCTSLKRIEIPRGTWEEYAEVIPKNKELLEEYLEKGCIPGRDIKYKELAERRLYYILHKYKDSTHLYDYELHYLGMDREYCYYSVSKDKSEYRDDYLSILAETEGFNRFRYEDLKKLKVFNSYGLIIAAGYYKTYTMKKEEFEQKKINWKKCVGFDFYSEFGAYMKYEDYKRLSSIKQHREFYEATGCESPAEWRRDNIGPDGEM